MPVTINNSEDDLFKNLLDEAWKFFEDVLKEIVEKKWSGYNQYILSYHELVLKSYKAGVKDELMPARPLSDNLLGTEESPSEAEKIALLEILKRAWVLHATLKKMINQEHSFELTPENVSIALSRVENICDRFHLLAIQIRNDYQKKQGVHIKDEYDVQHLFRSVLALDFDDVRPEVWTPLYAGKAARMDFLIMPYGIVIETKMTRKGLGHKQVGDQLLVDIARYREHNDCRILVCFIYDPENLVNNSTKLVKDLEKNRTDDLLIKVIIRPSGR